MIKRFATVMLIVFAIMLSVIFSSCDSNNSGKPDVSGNDNSTTINNDLIKDMKTSWDESLEIPKSDLLSLADPGDKLFSGLEWTGETNSKDANGNKVNQSDIVSIGEIDHHTTNTIVYASMQEAYEASLSIDPSLSSYYKLLTGEENVWQLAVYKNEEAAKDAGVLDFYKTNYNMSKAPKYEGSGEVSTYNTAYYGGFKDVTLPASWQTQGFDFPIYSNSQYPWDYGYNNGHYTVPLAPTVTNPVGFYRTEFDVDPSWIESGRRIYISFQGVESAYYLYVNGYEVGYSEDSFDASDFDITPYLNADGKDNLLAVKVHRWSDGSFFENQDYMRLAGIFRDVYLYSLPGVNVADYTVVTDLDDKFTDATLELSAEVFNSTVNDVEEGFFSLDVRLIDKEGNAVFGKKSVTQDVPAVKSGETVTVSLSKEIKAPHLWSDEDPYLYTMIITLYDKNGVYYGSLSQQLGFREISFTPTASSSKTNDTYSQILLNGKPLILKGVNRHDSNPETGRYMTKELLEKDILIMKSLNVNALRTSHYPNDSYLYNLCDKYGILVMGECNIETHYGVNEQQTSEFFVNLVTDRVDSHTEAKKNHACIIMWSIGNETSAGAPIYPTLIANLKEKDPTRPIHFESLGSSGGVDVSSTMYSSVFDVASRGTWSNNMPYLICEYAHSMGNSTGNLYEYWEAIRSHDNLLGGFIWDYVDQSMWTPLPADAKNDYYGNGKYLAYGGSWGDAPNSGNFLQNGIISSDRTLQPETAEVKYVYQSIWFDADVLTAENRNVSVYNEYRFTDLSEFDYTYELLCNGEVVDSGSFEVEGGYDETVNVTVPYNMPSDAPKDSEYFLTVYARLKNDTDYAEKGYVVASEQFSICCETENVTYDISKMSSVSYEEDDSTLTVNGDGFVLTFDKKNGNIKSYTYNGEEIISEGPVPNFTRARNDNDTQNLSWDSVKVDGVNSLTAEKDSSEKFITVKTELLLTNNAGTENITYIIYGDGSVTVECTLAPDESKGEMYRFGSVITLPGDYENIEFYGNGPVDTYCDRLRGSHKGIWNTTVTDSFYPYPKPQDTGVKTGVRYFALTSESKNTGIAIVAENEVEASALHHSILQLKFAKYVYNLSTTNTNTYLNVDYGSRGTGGASCGPDTLSQHRLYNDGRDYSYSYTIVPYDKQSDDLGDILRIWRDAESITAEDIDKMVASNVIDAIASLTTDSSKAKEVREAYDSLTDAQKKLVNNLNVLETIEKGKDMQIVFKDLSENGNIGTLEKGLVYADESSPTGYAVDGYFMSSDEGSKINKALSGNSEFTFAAFVRLDDFDSQNVILAKGDNQVAMKIDGSGRLEFFVYRGNWDAIITLDPTTAGLKIDEWAYVVGTREGSEIKLYVNGKLVGSASNASGSISSSNAQLGIGADPASNRFGRGSYAYAYVMPYAATEDQIKAQYDAHISGGELVMKPNEAVVWYDSSEFEYK